MSEISELCTEAIKAASEMKHTGHYDKAEALYREVLKHFPESVQALDGLWQIACLKDSNCPYFSAGGQDKFIYEAFFKEKEGGFFVDIGAFDGKEWSNTLFFEKSLGWDGLCVEPSPQQFDLLINNRKVVCLNIGVGDADGYADFIDIKDGYTMMGGFVEYYRKEDLETASSAPSHKSEVIRVATKKLSPLFREHAISHVDYCSIDVEGAELAIIENTDFEACTIDVFSIENNHSDIRLRAYLDSLNYKYVGTIGTDDIFEKR